MADVHRLKDNSLLLFITIVVMIIIITNAISDCTESACCL